jgi:hypothetical protein
MLLANQDVPRKRNTSVKIERGAGFRIIENVEFREKSRSRISRWKCLGNVGTLRNEGRRLKDPPPPKPKEKHWVEKGRYKNIKHKQKLQNSKMFYL